MKGLIGKINNLYNGSNCFVCSLTSLIPLVREREIFTYFLGYLFVLLKALYVLLEPYNGNLAKKVKNALALFLSMLYIVINKTNRTLKKPKKSNQPTKAYKNPQSSLLSSPPQILTSLFFSSNFSLFGLFLLAWKFISLKE